MNQRMKRMKRMNPKNLLLFIFEKKNLKLAELMINYRLHLKRIEQ